MISLGMICWKENTAREKLAGQHRIKKCGYDGMR
jgi:hypothetical protein